MGGYVDPSLEAILALRPDLIVGARGPSGPGLVAPFEERKIATYFPPTESIRGIQAMILGLSERVGHEEQGRVLVAEIEARIANIVEALRTAPRPRALLLFGRAPIVVAGPGSFAHELLGLAGADNVVPPGVAYPTVGLERVLAMDPDILLNASMAETHAAELQDEAGWRELRAIKEDNLRTISEEAVLRPGPRIAEGLAILARAIHPDIELL